MLICPLFFNDTAPTETYTLSYTTLFRSDRQTQAPVAPPRTTSTVPPRREADQIAAPWRGPGDRKSTRLNSSHRCISYAVFCLKKKKKPHIRRSSGDCNCEGRTTGHNGQC